MLSHPIPINFQKNVRKVAVQELLLIFSKISSLFSQLFILKSIDSLSLKKI